MLEGIVIVILLVFGTCFGGLILWKIFDMVRSSIKGKDNIEVTAEDFDRLARAFMHHKKEMEERMQNVEAIIADEDAEDHLPEIEAPRNEDILTNDLEHKKRVRS